MATVTIQRKREILDSAKGQMFQVTFKKADGTLRTMNTKKWAEQAFTYGSANAQANTVAHKPNYYTAVDVDQYKIDPKKSFRNISLENLISAKVGGILYIFDQV
jgi:hypothetical protein